MSVSQLFCSRLQSASVPFICGALIGLVCFAGHSAGTILERTNPSADLRVILHPVDPITIKQSDQPLAVILGQLGKQSGYRFVLDHSMKSENRRFCAILKNVPLNDVLRSMAYITKGVWERKGTVYHLRALTANERYTDTAQMEGLLSRAAEYLREGKDTMGDLPGSLASDLNSFLGAQPESGAVPLFPDGSLDKATIVTSPSSLNVALAFDGTRLTGSPNSKGIQGYSWKWNK